MFKKFFCSIVFSLGLMVIVATNDCSAKYLEVGISPDIYIYEKNEKNETIEGVLDICVQHMSQYPDELINICEKSKNGYAIKKIPDSYVHYNRLKDLSKKMQKLSWLAIQEMEEFQSNGCILDESIYRKLDFFPKIQEEFFKILLEALHMKDCTII